MRILGGYQVNNHIINHWFSTHGFHVDVSIRNEITSAYTTFGSITSIGNLYPFAQAIVHTNKFKNDEFRYNKNIIFQNGVKFNTYSESIAAQYAHLLAYTTLDDGIDDFTKTFIRLTPKLSVVQKSGARGSVLKWEQFQSILSSSSTYYGEIEAVANVLLNYHLGQYLREPFRLSQSPSGKLPPL
jgi:hypothetical protein